MKKNSLFIGLAILAILASAFTFIQRRHLFYSDVAVNMKVELVGITYGKDLVAIEYDLEGIVTTPDGNFNNCPTGNSNAVTDKNGKEISTEIYTSCRPVSNEKYSVTQIFYGDYEKHGPKKVKINIGDFTFFSPNENKEIYVPVISSFVFDLPANASSEGVFAPKGIVQGSHGVDLAVKSAVFTPRAVKIDTCVTLPDRGDWGLDAHVVLDGQSFPIDYWEIPNYKDPKTFTTNKRCFSVFASNIPDFRNLKSDNILFVVDKIYRNMPDCVYENDFLKIKDELAKFGIAPTPDVSGNYCFVDDIVDNTNPEDNAYLFGFIKDALKDEVPGPFEIAIR